MDVSVHPFTGGSHPTGMPLPAPELAYSATRVCYGQSVLRYIWCYGQPGTDLAYGATTSPSGTELAHATAADVRITTRYSEENWMEGVMGTIHECGHAMYEQGRSAQNMDLPVSEPLGMATHESQSLLWER
eukprot:687008-Rhodomonas_salina.1